MESSELVLCSGSVLNASLRGVVEAAVAGGFKGISIWPHQVERDRAAGLRVADLRGILGDSGVEVVEVEPVLSWVPEHMLPPELRPLLGTAPEVFLDLAQALGAQAILACDGFGARAPLPELADAFGELCDRAAERELRVKFEFLPWSSIPDASAARDFLALAGRDNAGIVIDTWHFFRGSNDLAQIAALPGDLILGVQMNDAPAVRVGDDLAQESMHHRLLPGQGAIDLVGLVRTLDAIGSRAPIGAEVFSDELNTRPSAQVGSILADATRSVLAAARV